MKNQMKRRRCFELKILTPNKIKNQKNLKHVYFSNPSKRYSDYQKCRLRGDHWRKPDCRVLSCNIVRYHHFHLSPPVIKLSC